MVNKRNIYLRGLHGSASAVTVNIGNLPQLQQPSVEPPATSSSLSPMQRLLKAAKENGGQLSIAQAAMHTQLEPEQLRDLLQEATKAEYAQIINDPQTGAIRYYFDV